MYDTDQNGVVDVVELATGLSLLCGGSHDKVMEAFALYDLNSGACLRVCACTVECCSVSSMWLTEAWATPQQMAMWTGRRC